MKTARSRAGALLLACVACAACADGRTGEGLVARVDGHTLSVDDVVDMLVDEERLPARAGLIEQIANLWIDYTLLAEAAVEDSTFRSIDVAPLVRQQIQQVMIFQLMDSVTQADTAIADDELERLYEAETPELQVRARHILLTYPLQPTAAQRDSVRARLEAVRARIVAGAPFAEVARQVSQDRGSAADGGDLGYFGRGDMVAPFERAALALEPGQMSEVVETPLGLHLIRLEDRRVQGFAQIRDQFRARVQTQRLLQAESTYLAVVEGAVGPEIAEGAFEVAREVARNPAASFSGRARRRALVAYEGGSLTVGELQEVLQSQPGLSEQVAEGEDDELERFLGSLVQRELLVEEARRAGLGPADTRVDSLHTEARDELRAAARAIGLLDVEAAPGEPVSRAVDRAVRESLSRILAGVVDMVPLGAVSFQLRRGHAPALYTAGVGEAILRIGDLRARRSLSPQESLLDSVLAPLDTAGR